MSKFNAQINKQADGILVKMSGVIDEDVDFSSLSLEGQKKIEIELDGLKSINSCGIREWIKWMGTAKDADIVFSNCPKVIVDQINMVDGFLPATGKVQSFYVPYYNDEAGSEKNVLFRYGTEYSESGLTPPASIKDEEGNEMEMDVVEAKYFKFLK